MKSSSVREGDEYLREIHKLDLVVAGMKEFVGKVDDLITVDA